MAATIRIPALPSGTPDEQVQTLYRYLYQLTEQLNVELDKSNSNGVSVLERALGMGNAPSKSTAPKDVVETYNQLKALIIKTATEAEASTRKIVFDITDEYRAQSEFGTYTEYLNNEISLGADGVVMEWSAENGITTPVGDFGEYKAESSAYMQLGIVQYNDDGTVEAGVVIGKDLQRVTVDGKELVRSGNIYCLLKADALSFWRNGVKLSEYGLYSFFAEKAYINEVYTALIRSPTFGAEIDLSKNNSITLTADQINVVADEIDLSANKTIRINGTQISDGSITAKQLAASAVTADKIAAGAITAGKIEAGAVEAEKIAAGAVTADKIAANAITAAKINVDDLFASEATIDAINAMDITGNSYLRLMVGDVAGGINLLKDSGKAVANGYYPTATYTMSDIPKEGERVTVTLYSSYMEGVEEGVDRVFSVYHGDGQTFLANLRWVSEGRYTATFEFRAPVGGGTPGNLRVYSYPQNPDRVTHIGKIKLERGTRSTEWTPSPLDVPDEVIAGSTVFINEETVQISTPEFNVNTEGARFNIPGTGDDSAVEINKNRVHFSTPAFEVNTEGAKFNIPGTENGAPAVEIDKTGMTAIDINVRNELHAPNVSESTEGDIVMTVGTGGDYGSISEAMEEINGKQLMGNVYMKLLSDTVEPVTIKGLSGPGGLYIAPINLVPWNVSGTKWTTNNVVKYNISLTAGFYVYAETGGTWRSATVHLGEIGAMGIRPGMKLTYGCHMQITQGTAYAVAIVYIGGVYVADIYGRQGTDTTNVWAWETFTVPENAKPWDEMEIAYRIAGSTACSDGAQVNFRNPRLEFGSAISSANNGYTLGKTGSITLEANAAPVYLHEVQINGPVRVNHSGVSLNRCQIYADNGVIVWGGNAAMYNCLGTCEGYAARAMGGGAIEISGTSPSGARAGLIDDGSAGVVAPGDPPATTAPTVETFEAKYSGTYSGSAWWNSDAALRQGYIEANGELRGGVWFEHNISASAITKMTLRLRRVEGYGKAAAVDVKIYGTNSGALSGKPATAGTAVTGTIGQGKSKTFDITSLKGYKGFVLVVGDNAVLSGKTYSTNYARFTGTGGGKDTIPMLTITYNA